MMRTIGGGDITRGDQGRMTRSGQHDKRDDARQVGSKRHERKGADDSKAIGRGTTTGRQWDDRRGGGRMLGDPAADGTTKDEVGG